MQPCGFARHWEVFSSARGLVPRKRKDLWRAVALLGGPHFLPPQLCCQGSQSTFTCPEKGPRGAQCLTPLQYPLCPHHPLLPPGHISQEPWLPPLWLPPGAISGEHMGLISGPAVGRAPCHPYQWGGSRPGDEGSQPHSCCAGATAGGIVTAPHCPLQGMLNVLRPLSSLVASVAVTLIDL